MKLPKQTVKRIRKMKANEEKAKLARLKRVYEVNKKRAIAAG